MKMGRRGRSMLKHQALEQLEQNTRKADLRNERGAVMLLAMILMVVLSLLTVSLFELLKASTQIAGNHRLDFRTTYIADAGVEHAMNELRDNPALDDGVAEVELFTDEPFEDGMYTVIVKDRPRTNPAIFDEADITSTGEIAGFQRTIEAHVKIIVLGGTDPITYAVTTTSWKLRQ